MFLTIYFSSQLTLIIFNNLTNAANLRLIELPHNYMLVLHYIFDVGTDNFHQLKKAHGTSCILFSNTGPTNAAAVQGEFIE